MRYTPEFLDSLRLEGDPVPDQIIEELAREGQIDDVNLVLKQLVRNTQPVPAELPDNIEFWLRDTAKLPAWADPQRLARASALFVEHGLTMFMLFSTSSLLEAYAARKAIKVLTYTYRLEQNAHRRVAETAQWLLAVLPPGGLSENGGGLRATQKIRLMHSAIRYLIRQTGTWPEQELGTPICQEDMLGMSLCLSLVVLRDMRELGIKLSDEDADDFLYQWRVIGELLGVRPDILPENFAEAEIAFKTITARQHGPSPEGIKMARALLEMHADLIPGETFDGIMPAFMRRLIGDQIADWLELPRTGWEVVVQHDQAIARMLDSTDRGAGGIADIADRLGMAFLNRESIALNSYQRTAFAIPETLREAWNVPTHAAQA